MATIDADLHDPFGFNHPGALVILGASTIATFATMFWMGKKNEEDHQHLQNQLDNLDKRLTAHENDNTRHVGVAR